MNYVFIKKLYENKAFNMTKQKLLIKYNSIITETKLSSIFSVVLLNNIK